MRSELLLPPWAMTCCWKLFRNILLSPSLRFSLSEPVSLLDRTISPQEVSCNIKKHDTPENILGIYSSSYSLVRCVHPRSPPSVQLLRGPLCKPAAFLGFVPEKRFLLCNHLFLTWANPSVSLFCRIVPSHSLKTILDLLQHAHWWPVCFLFGWLVGFFSFCFCSI